MPSYTRTDKPNATHLEADSPLAVRGRTCEILQKVDHGFLVKFTIGNTGHHDYAYVPNAGARLFKEHVPPKVTFGVGRMGQINVGIGVLSTVILGRVQERNRKDTEDFIRRSSECSTKWTHVITYHDNKPVGIEELL